MKNKVYPDFDAAVADVPDGITFMSAGFGGVGVPRNLLSRTGLNLPGQVFGPGSTSGTTSPDLRISSRSARP